MNKKKSLLIVSGICGTGLFLFFTNNKIPVILLFLVVLFLIIRNYQKKRTKKKEDTIPILTPEKEKHYEETGMSNQEIEFFRKTMHEVQQQIIQLEKNISRSAKLKAIDLNYDTVNISKEIFKELVKKPQKLHTANHFLYTYLPNIVELSTQYLEINQVKVKNKTVYNKLYESAETISYVAQNIKKEYEQFIDEQLEKVDLEISIAKNKQNADNKER